MLMLIVATHVILVLCVSARGARGDRVEATAKGSEGFVRGGSLEARKTVTADREEAQRPLDVTDGA